MQSGEDLGCPIERGGIEKWSGPNGLMSDGS